MSEMVERIACVIERDIGKGGWGSYIDPIEARQCARHILQAMLAPTDGMLHRIPGASHDAREASWIATWRDMIEQALR